MASLEDAGFGFWLAALVPLVVLLYLLVVRHWRAATAAPVAFLIAVVVAVVLYRAPLGVVGLLTLRGAWDAASILYVVVPALFLYQVAREAGTFDVIRRGIEAYTPNDLLHVLAFGWVFASFLQGITGFGVPALVTAPLLVAMRVKPLWAAVIALVGHGWANTFGTLAVAWEGLLTVTDLDDPALTARLAALMLLVANVLAGLLIAWFYGRARGVREALPAVLVIGGIHGLGQLVLAPIVPTLSTLLPGAVALGAVLWLGTTRWYRVPTAVTASPVMQDEEPDGQGQHPDDADRPAGDEPGPREMPLWLAMVPYMLLIALILIVRLVPDISTLFAGIQLGFSSPRLETELGFVTPATDAYRPLTPLTHPGTFLLVTAVATFLIFRRRGDIAAGRFAALGGQTLRTSLPSAVAFLALIPLTTVMEGSGQTFLLATTLADIAPGLVYASLAPLIGAIGAFMTSSNLSSNILFGPLQETAAAGLELPEAPVLAGQTAGAAVGNTMAPGNILLAAGSVGVGDQSGAILRQTLRYTVPLVVVLGAVTAAAAWLLPAASL